MEWGAIPARTSTPWRSRASTTRQSSAARRVTTATRRPMRAATWAPDGKHIAYISDATGEEEIWVVEQAGTGKASPDSLVAAVKMADQMADKQERGMRSAERDKAET